VDRVERRTIQIKEEAVRAEEERTAAARADIPAAAFTMPLEQANLKEHVFNILTEAGFENIGDLMYSLKTDQNKVLGLSGIGSKAIQNIEEALAAIAFPEPVVEEAPVVEEVPAAAVTSEIVVEVPAVPGEEKPISKKQAEAKKEAKRHAGEEPENEFAKDGVSLDELFKMKPETFQVPATDEDSDDKKKGKKVKKKGVALEFDEGLGEVVGRKKHKRGDDSTTGEDWE
jgi:hypothetical protein